MKNTPETTTLASCQPEIAHCTGDIKVVFSKLADGFVARIAALIPAFTLVAATSCGQGEDEKGKPVPPPPAEIPECQQPENLNAPAPCAQPTTYAWEGDRLIVNFWIPEYNELCKNPVEVGVLGNVWKTKKDGTTDLEPMQPLEGMTFVYDSDPETQKADPYFVDAEVPQADLSAFALTTTDAYGHTCVSNPVSTTTRPE